MIVGSIARRYAKALLAIGIETRLFEKFGKELDQFAELLQHPQLRDLLDNPSYPLSKRKAVLEDLVGRLRPSPKLRNFLLLLMDRGRISSLPIIAREYQGLADKHAGRIRARVVSPQPLDLATSTRLKKALAQRTGQQIILDQVTDPTLIGGMITQMGSIVYDGSIRTSLQQMRDALLRQQ